MSYLTASSEKYTMIDELLDLDDLEEQVPNNQNSSAIRSSQGRRMFNESNIEDKYKKFIREPYMSHPSSGMLPGNYHQQEEEYQQPRRQHVPMGQPMGQPMGHYDEKIQSTEPIKTYTMPQNSPTCLEISDHITNCPICSKFYNTDKTIYYVAISILTIVCLGLLVKNLQLNK